MQKFYFKRAIDLFEIAISVPGIARSWLYKEAKQHNAYFFLIAEEDDDLHHTLKQNLVGGYSGTSPGNMWPMKPVWDMQMGKYVRIS